MTRRLLSALLVSGCGAAGQANPTEIGPQGVDELVIPTPNPDRDDFVDVVDNPWLPLEPGTVWTYNNSAIQTLEAVLTKATGQQPNDYAKKRIFEPLGMDDTEWLEDASGNAMTFAGVQSTCLDLARFGLLMQHEGEWKGEQVVSAARIEESEDEAEIVVDVADQTLIASEAVIGGEG